MTGIAWAAYAPGKDTRVAGGRMVSATASGMLANTVGAADRDPELGCKLAAALLSKGVSLQQASLS